MFDKLIDTSHPMLNPLWVRLLMTGATCGWAVFEWLLGNSTWAFIFGAVGLICIHKLFLTYVPPETEAEPE